MSRWAPQKRTRADRERDCQLFCVQATLERVQSITDEELAARHDIPLVTAKYHRAVRLGKGW